MSNEKNKLNDCLRYFVLKNKKVQYRKKDKNKIYKDEYDSTT